jgi:hypothetical protein
MSKGASWGVWLWLALPVAAASEVPRGSEFAVNTYTTEAQRRHDVAMDPSGGFLVVWESREEDGSSWGVFARRFDPAGAPLTAGFQVNTYTALSQYRPRVAASASGEATVVWSGLGPDGWGIHGRRFDATGAALGAEFQVNTYTTAGRYSGIAASGAGRFVVVWEAQPRDGDGYGVFGQRFDAAGNPQGGEFRANAYTTSEQRMPRAAMDAAGNFVVVWASYLQDGYGWGVFGRRFAASGDPLGAEIRVNTYTTGEQQRPSVAMDVAGNFVVVWTSFGPAYRVLGQRYDQAGAALGGEFLVSALATGLEADGAVAADADGDFLVAWTGYDQSGLGAFARAFDARGNPAGGNFRVSSYTTGNQRTPSLSAAPGGDFVTVWISLDQDGDDDGVFGQRYAAEVIFRDGFDGP